MPPDLEAFVECEHKAAPGTRYCPGCGLVSDLVAAPIAGRYRIRKKLGSGAMGVVYLAKDEGLERSVAVKFLDPAIAQEPAAIDAFRKEAKAVAAIRHEHVVAVHDIGEHKGRPFFVMVFIRGLDLDEIMEEHAAQGDLLPTERAIAILLQVGAGLEAVHRRGLLHRDIKPRNIVVEEDTGRPVLIDFGLVKQLENVGETRGGSAGTPLYMAPEQCMETPDRPPVGPRADLYSFACTAFELLTGQPVFEGHTWFELMRQHLMEAPRKLSSVRPELSHLDAPILRALSKDPEHRQGSIAEFLRDLEDAAGDSVREMRGAAEKAAARHSSSPAGRPFLKAMIVDDDPQFIRFAAGAVKLGLGKSAEIFQAASPLAALEKFESDPVDLILLDFDMPQFDGVQLLNMIRLLPRGSKARVVVITVHDDEKKPYKFRFSSLGVRDFARKPVDLRELAQLVKDVADRSAWTKSVD